MPIEEHTKRMYNQFGSEYQKSRDERKKERVYNEFLEVPSMVKAVGNIGSKRLLDVGCGAGIHAKKYLQKGAKVEGVDISETMIKLARKNCPDVNFKIGTITKLPYKSSSFDVVTASLVIDYVDNLNKAFSEVNRVLKKKGLFYYSRNSPEASARELKVEGRYRYCAVGAVRDTKNKRLIPLGTHWKEGIQKFEMFPGMTLKYYKRSFSTNLKAIVKSGFELVNFIDCKPTPTFKNYDQDTYRIFTKFPLFSIYVCRKK